MRIVLLFLSLCFCLPAFAQSLELTDPMSALKVQRIDQTIRLTLDHDFVKPEDREPITLSVEEFRLIGQMIAVDKPVNPLKFASNHKCSTLLSASAIGLAGWFISGDPAGSAAAAAGIFVLPVLGNTLLFSSAFKRHMHLLRTYNDVAKILESNRSMNDIDAINHSLVRAIKKHLEILRK